MPLVRRKGSRTRLDRYVAPQVTLREGFDLPENGTVNRTVAGQVYDTQPYELTAVTITTSDGQEVTTPLNASTAPATNATFSTTIRTDEVVTIEASVRDPVATDEGRGGDDQIGTATATFDGDGLPAAFERTVAGMDPTSPNSDSNRTAADESNNSIPDGAEDLDGDSVLLAREAALGTDPTTNDTDGDGLSDRIEITYAAFDPTDPDVDDDGMPDGRSDPDNDSLTAAEEIDLGSDPFENDTDGDGLTDPEEVAFGSSPVQVDTDEDGLTDADERALGTDPRDPDTDDDGVPDSEETFTTRTGDDSLGASVSVTGDGNLASEISVENGSTPVLDSAAVDEARVSPIVEFESDRSFGRAELSLAYDRSAVEAPTDLSVYRYNETFGTFVRLNSTVDTANGTVSTTTHFSRYVLFPDARWLDASDDQGEEVFDLDIGSANGSDVTRTNRTILTDNFNDGDLSEWTISTSGDADVRVVQGRLRLRVYRCSRASATRELGTFSGENVTVRFDWETAAEGFWERPDWRLVNARTGEEIPYTVTGGQDVRTPQFDNPDGSVVAEARVNGTVPIEFEIQPSRFCGNLDHGNTFYWIDNLNVTQSSAEPTEVVDSDGDGLSDALERAGIPTGRGDVLSTSPVDADSDNDGLTDGEEVGTFVDVSESGGVVTIGGRLYDLPDGQRVAGDYFRLNSDPTQLDGDGDGLSDREELRESRRAQYTANASQSRKALRAEFVDPLTYFENESVTSDPLRADTDGDGLSDSREATLRTNPRNEDTDGDGLADGVERAKGEDSTLFDYAAPNVVVESISPTVEGIDGPGDLQNTTPGTSPLLGTAIRYEVTVRVTDAAGLEQVTVQKRGAGEAYGAPETARAVVEFDGETQAQETVNLTVDGTRGLDRLLREQLTIGSSVGVSAVDVNDNRASGSYLSESFYSTLARGNAEALPAATVSVLESLPGEQDPVTYVAGLSGSIYGVRDTLQDIAGVAIGAANAATFLIGLTRNPTEFREALLEVARVAARLAENPQMLEQLPGALVDPIVAAQRGQNPFERSDSTARENYNRFAGGWYAGYVVGVFGTEVLLTKGVSVTVGSLAKVSRTAESALGLYGGARAVAAATTVGVVSRGARLGARSLVGSVDEFGETAFTGLRRGLSRLSGASQCAVIRQVRSVPDGVRSRVATAGVSDRLVGYVARTGSEGSERLETLDVEAEQTLLNEP